MKFFKDIYQYDKKIIVITIIIILLLGLGIYLYIKNNSKEEIIEPTETIKLVLFGAKEITINQGEKYVEPGYYAISSNGIIKTNEVIVTPTEVDTNIPGTYYINYVIGNKMEKRTLVVLENKEKGILTLTLEGEEKITIKLNEEYIEPGYQANDTVDGNLTDFVKVSGTINTAKRGTYTITYQVSNSEGEVVSKTRTIIVE